MLTRRRLLVRACVVPVIASGVPWPAARRAAGPAVRPPVPRAAPWTGFVDFNGWIIPAADRDALAAIEAAGTSRRYDRSGA